MKTLIDNLQKYYGVYLLIIAVMFFIAWFPNRAANRYDFHWIGGSDFALVRFDKITGRAHLAFLSVEGDKWSIFDTGTGKIVASSIDKDKPLDKTNISSGQKDEPLDLLPITDD